ncbi:hypothetical protein GCM10018793_43210 [Streptomyces sulfonofaciens]|uniref:Uncharacterized protein n=1 Tax=Streptomyces sulfonofaciens TaxID=68272 RepID=A0A919L2S8_9ACTN|nr:hypothetical protein GCM10018793_43210 [Streptomyces sulfonofaciens]
MSVLDTGDAQDGACSSWFVADGPGGFGDVLCAEGHEHAEGLVAEGPWLAARPRWTVEVSPAKAASVMWWRSAGWSGGLLGCSRRRRLHTATAADDGGAYAEGRQQPPVARAPHSVSSSMLLATETTAQAHRQGRRHRYHRPSRERGLRSESKLGCGPATRQVSADPASPARQGSGRARRQAPDLLVIQGCGHRGGHQTASAPPPAHSGKDSHNHSR